MGDLKWAYPEGRDPASYRFGRDDGYAIGYAAGLRAALDDDVETLTGHHLGDGDELGEAARRLWPKIKAALAAREERP